MKYLLSLELYQPNSYQMFVRRFSPASGYQSDIHSASDWISLVAIVYWLTDTIEPGEYISNIH
jgi:hypothetical protein